VEGEMGVDGNGNEEEEEEAWGCGEGVVG